MALSGKLKRPESLTDVIVREIQNRIIEGVLDLGEAISENTLAKEFGTSKTPVRDAIQRLHAERLVDILPSRGTLVFSLDTAEVEQLSAFRLVLESSAVRLSMELNPASFGQQLADITEQMQDARAREDLTTYRHLDADFHRCFFSCSGNKYLIDAYGDVRVQIQALRTRLSIDPKHIEDSYQEHLRMVALVRAGKTDELLTLVAFHINNTMKSFKIALAGIGPGILRSQKGATPAA